MRTTGICGCGCGQKTNWNKAKKAYNKFCQWHHSKANPTFKGRKHTEEAKKKISKARAGKKLSEAHKLAISIGGTGLKRSELTKSRISTALKRHEYDPKRIELLKKNAFDATGRKWSEEMKEKISKSNIGKHSHSGKSNPNWKEGISFLPYSSEWTKELKEAIRSRDGDVCQNPDCCGKSDNMSVHHIDYIKENCDHKNLITLCFVCNSKANGNRQHWELFYNNIIQEKYLV